MTGQLWAVGGALCVVLLAGAGQAQSNAARTPSTRQARAETAGERLASAVFERARASKAGPLDAAAFLRRMPKGGDLHMHLSGAVYAETFLRDGAADGLCIDGHTFRFVKGQAGGTCPEGDVAASTVFTDQNLYDRLVDSFSMRGFVPAEGVTGHDQFFATFDRFGEVSTAHEGEWLDEVASRAASQNEQYLEIMTTPTFAEVKPVATRLGWPRATATGSSSAADARGDATGTSAAELERMRQELLPAVQDEVNKDEAEIAEALAARKRIEHCGEASAAPGCAVTIRFVYQVLRANPPEQVFARTLLGFELAKADPEHFVGINFVQPEDAYLAMSEYNRQMHMLDFLHAAYPGVHITLHAGELAPGLVPPDGLRFHIREAVELGHAERIGHGVDVMHEDDPQGLLREMAARHVAVEINLTSNAVILGVAPPFHPLPDYRAAHVPVLLSTDDEGVARIDLTHEYALAAVEYGLSYVELKDMVRTSMEHSFLPGESLWAAEDEYARMKPACAGQRAGAGEPAGGCAALLRRSEKAAAEWELERRFVAFEASLR